ncbi:MAG: hypothetical protein CMA63_06215 [Euryarchaeota archaeon]|jgi:hypothetical protein|nr:hypothetical protein [Euryarchaeota archaeon]|tara:strand:+ start:12140 stop:12391 length:252 start_codon:yes stop_codon:yes gene_type:complete
MTNIKDQFNPYGPFTISSGKAYIKHQYVPFELGSLELQQVIKNHTSRLEKELRSWQELAQENERIKNESSTCDRGHSLSCNAE